MSGRTRAAAVAARMASLPLLCCCLAFIPAYAQTSEERAETARMQAQIQELQEELRRMTGRLEQSEYSQRQLQSRIDRLVGDVDVRLRAIEQGLDTPSSIPPADDVAGQPAASASPNEESSLPVITAGSSTGQGGEQLPDGSRIIGTIPGDVLLGIPVPQNTDGANSANLPAEALSGSDPATRYQAIAQLLGSSDLQAAKPALEAYVADFPQAENAPEAAFMLGEIWFLDEAYPEAAARFAENFRTFGAEAPRAADNLLKLGMSLARLGDPERACTALIEFERRYPDAGQALQQTASRERQAAACP